MEKEVKLVIKISEEVYNRILKSGVISGSDTAYIGGVIIDGIELPENHGDLKEKIVTETCKTCANYSEYGICDLGLMCIDGSGWCPKQASEALDMAIKALEKPNIDAVNRQAVLDTLDKMDKALDVDRTVENYKELLMECYKDLPPVTPKEKTGKWIEKWDSDHLVILAYECSKCGMMMNVNTSHYCPNCGARMTE